MEYSEQRKKPFYSSNLSMKYIRYSKIRLMLLNPNSLLRHFLKTCSINNKYMYFTFEKLNDRFEVLPVACDFRLKDVI